MFLPNRVNTLLYHLYPNVSRYPHCYCYHCYPHGIHGVSPRSICHGSPGDPIDSKNLHPQAREHAELRGCPRFEHSDCVTDWFKFRMKAAGMWKEEGAWLQKTQQIGIWFKVWSGVNWICDLNWYCDMMIWYGMIVQYNTRKNCNWQPTTRAMFNNECLLDTYCRAKNKWLSTNHVGWFV